MMSEDGNELLNLFQGLGIKNKNHDVFVDKLKEFISQVANKSPTGINESVVLMSVFMAILFF